MLIQEALNWVSLVRGPWLCWDLSKEKSDYCQPGLQGAFDCVGFDAASEALITKGVQRGMTLWYTSEGTKPGFGLEGFESFRLFQKGFASSSPKNFGLEFGFRIRIKKLAPPPKKKIFFSKKKVPLLKKFSFLKKISLFLPRKKLSFLKKVPHKKIPFSTGTTPDSPDANPNPWSRGKKESQVRV